MPILAAIGETSEAEYVIEVAADLARAYDEPLSVLHVIPEDEARAHFESLREIPEYKDLSIGHEDDRAVEIAETAIEAWDGSPEAVEVRGLGKVGDPSATILEQADALGARYIVIGGRRRSPAGKAIFGSVTQSVLLDSSIPVVTVMRGG